MPQTPTQPSAPLTSYQQTAQNLIHLIAETYGIDTHEISLDSDLVDDIGWSMNPEETAYFLKRINMLFDVHINKQLILEEEAETVGALADLIESEQLG